MSSESSSRPLIVGPDSGPEPPFPLRVSGKIVNGFGRGSKELGIPTANIPISGLSVGGHEDVESGVYYGWAGLNVDENGNITNANASHHVSPSTSDDKATSTTTNGAQQHAPPARKIWTYPMVMSIGWNPFYKNTKRSVMKEVHILHPFPKDFYGAHMNLLIMGFIRPERDYQDLDSLVADIRTDMEVAKKSLAREGYERWKGDAFLLRCVEGGEDDVGT